MDWKLNTPTKVDPVAEFAAREKRVQDVIALREPDRVPFYFSIRFWPSNMAGMTCEQAMYDPAATAAAALESIVEFQPDLYQVPAPIMMHGPALETMDLQTLAWPGHGTNPNVSFQYLDRELMKADEYDDYLFDPSGYFLKTYLPRIAGVFEPFSKLPDFGYVYHTGSVAAARSFADPDIKRAFEILAKAGDQQSAAVAIAVQFVEDMAELGFPDFSVSTSSAPFDLIADYYRGSKGAMLDMFRQPDKLLAAMEKARVFILNASIAAAEGKRGKLVFIPLHWGLDGFMSPEQFNTFYWPQLRAIILDLIDADLVPYVFWEGDCATRLETITDIPPGKAIYKFERTDMLKAKAILGDTVCIQGNVPGSLLNAGTPDEVDAYCKKLIQGVKQGGGFILDGAVGVPDEAKYENLVAMAQAVHKYGVYG